MSCLCLYALEKRISKADQHPPHDFVVATLVVIRAIDLNHLAIEGVACAWERRAVVACRKTSKYALEGKVNVEAPSIQLL